MKWQEFERWGMHNTQFGTSIRKAITITKPLVVGLAVTDVAALGKLFKKIAKNSTES